MTASPVEVALADLELASWVRPGDTVVWGQACSEPTPLVASLMNQRASIGGRFRCFLGIGVQSPVLAEHADVIDFVGYIGMGRRELVVVGAMDPLPVHFSELPHLLSTGALAADVVLVQVTPPDSDGRYAFAAAQEYLPSAIAGARVVIAEVNDQAPRIYGGRNLGEGDIDVIVRTSRPLHDYRPPAESEVERTIGQRVASLVPDGATIQTGVGAVPEAVLRALHAHRNLGVHSGILTDGVMALMTSGVITNAQKSSDVGMTVAGGVIGTSALFDFAHDNALIELRPTDEVHGAAALARHDRLVAINSAIEVDLTGQANAEVAAGVYVGGVGGAGDFLRAASRSAGGLPIIALPSMAGSHSRIVVELSGPVTTPRSDVGIVVTEHGVADLRGLTMSERRTAMVAVAHPDVRRSLAR